MAIALDALRAEEQARADRVDDSQRRLAEAVQSRIAAAAAPDDPAARRRLARAVQTEQRLAGRLRAELEDAGRLPQLIAVLTPDEVLGSLEPHVPLALLPVRLETRYRTVGAETQLHVRVYPEPIHIDAHEPELTAEEFDAGTAFWAAAAGGEDAAREAWATLAGFGGQRRAAWIRLTTAPGAPAVARKRAAWSRAARATALPDRFMFLALRAGRRVATTVGEPVKRPLAVGPDPAVQQGTGPAGLDEGTRWMVEFDAAEQAGMAARLIMPPGDPNVDRLLVVGVAASLSPQQAGAVLDRLLGAHRFTDGLELLPAGTPTNVSTVPAAPPVEDLYARETAPPPSEVPAGATPEAAARAAATDAARLASALGAGAEHFGRAANAGDLGEPDARAMLAVLWPGTLGYYLDELLGGSTAEEEAEQLRAHAVAWVRSRGPLATLRVGSQPYGVLPVTSLVSYAPGATAPSGAPHFLELLYRLDRIWATAARSLPRAGAGADPEAAMAEILGQAPVAVDYDIRKIHYQGTIIELAALAGLNDDERAGLAGLHEALTNAGSRLVGRMAEGDGLRLTVGADATHHLALPRVQAGALSDAAPLSPNYLTFLRTASIADVIAGERLYGSPLLYLLARIGVLWQYVRAVKPARGSAPTPQEWLDRHVIVDGLQGVSRGDLPLDLLTTVRVDGATGPPLVDIVRTGAIELATERSPILTRSGFGMPIDGIGGPGGPPFSPRMAVRAAAAPGPVAAAAEAAPPPKTDAVAEVLAGLAHLESRPTSVLDRLLRETLDLASHRLDAWVTSLATERLSAMRARPGTEGVHLGAFGWVENLAPGAPLTAVAAADHSDIARPLFRRADSAGFIHAPSLAHAATAGVLRSAHLAHGGGPELAIDLSSGRVRPALWLLDGVRAGQPLAALLGYRLERALHDHGHDGLIAGLRDAAPLSRTRLAADGEPSEAVAAHDVVDGLRLLELLSAGEVTVDDLAPAADRSALAHELDALADAADAVADVLMAESVHQLVSGNPARASAAAAAAAGAHVPADLDVVRTRLGGITTVHRVALVHGGQASQAWPAAAGQVRAVLDPILEDLAARWLGAPSRVRVGLRWRDRQSGAVTAPDPDDAIAFIAVTLDVLGLSALDVVMTAGPSTADTRGEVERRLADHALLDGVRPAGAAPDADVELVLDVAQAAGGVDLPTLLAVARALRRALGRSRALEPADLAPTGTGDDAAVDVSDLDARIAATLGITRAASSALAGALVGEDANLDLDAVRNALRAVAVTGVPGAWPLSPAGDGDAVRASLLAQARSVATELESRLGEASTAITALAAPAGALGTAAEAQARRAAVQDLFGEELPLLAPVRGPRCATALAALASPPDVGPAGATRAGRASLLRSYVTAAAGVRRDLAALDDALGLGVAVGAPEPAALVAQLSVAPATAGERWVGLADAPGQPLGGRTSLVALAPAGDPSGADSISGLLVDEWLEVVPAEQQVTALAIHANRPNAEAPQAILLAVPPDEAKAWDLDTLAAVLDETLDRAARRTVDLPALPVLGHQLPALYINSTDIARVVGVDFDRIVTRPVRP